MSIIYTTIFLFHVAFTFDNYEKGLTIIQLNPNLNHTFHWPANAVPNLV